MRLFYVILLDLIIVPYGAYAQSLPANPWAVGAVETYKASEVSGASEAVPSDNQVATANAQQSLDSISENMDILMNYFNNDTSAQEILKPQNSAVESNQTAKRINTLNHFLQNIEEISSSMPQNTAKPAQESSSGQSLNPVAEVEAAYNRYLDNLRQKYNNTTRAVQNYYRNAVNGVKNWANNSQQSLKKMLK